jgi:hypothetical protein
VENRFTNIPSLVIDGSDRNSPQITIIEGNLQNQIIPSTIPISSEKTPKRSSRTDLKTTSTSEKISSQTPSNAQSSSKKISNIKVEPSSTMSVLPKESKIDFKEKDLMKNKKLESVAVASILANHVSNTKYQTPIPNSFPLNEVESKNTKKLESVAIASVLANQTPHSFPLNEQNQKKTKKLESVAIASIQANKI